MGKLISAFAVTAAFLIGSASADDFVQSVHVYGTIGSIDGAKTVLVRRSNGNHELKPGDPVQPGDLLQTDSKTTTTIRCSDGSVLVLGHSTDVGIENAANAQRTARINSGTIRAIVSKINTEKNQEKKKFRFFIKTRTATLGVRGTDFVVSADSATETVELHTLEGTVEAAKDETALVTKGGEMVRGGQYILATQEEITSPQVFDQKRFAEQLEQTQPGLAVPIAQPAPAVTPSPVPIPTPTATEEPDREPSRSSLQSAEVAFRHVSGDFSTKLKGVEVNWTPMLQLISHWLALRGTAGVLLSSGGGQVVTDGFFGVDARIMLSARLFKHILIEFGPTFEHWNHLGNFSGPSLNVGWEFARDQIGALDRIFVSIASSGHPGWFDDRARDNKLYGNCGMGPCNENHGDLVEFRVGAGFRF